MIKEEVRLICDNSSCDSEKVYEDVNYIGSHPRDGWITLIIKEQLPNAVKSQNIEYNFCCPICARDFLNNKYIL